MTSRRRACGHTLMALLLAMCSTGTCAWSQAAAKAEQGALEAGMHLLRQGNAAAAKEQFSAAIKAAPASAAALTWRGICENQLQQYAAAAADFKAALRLDNTMLPAHYNLALALIRLHSNDAAIAQLKAVVAAQPEALPALYNLAILLEAKDAPAEALEYLRRARTLAPADSGVAFHLLRDELRSNPGADVTPLLASLQEPSTPASTQGDAASELLAAGRASDALTLASLAHAQSPEDRAVSLVLARSMVSNRQFAEAVALLQSVPETTPADDDVAYLQGLSFAGSGDRAAAEKSFRRAMAIDSRDSRPVFQLGLLSAATRGQESAAVELLLSAHRLDPSNQSYTLALARVLLATDRADEAKALLLKLPEPHAPYTEEAGVLLTLRGIAMAATHDNPDAVHALTAAIAIDPSIALTQNVLGFCLMQQGQYPQAARAYGTASELDQRNALFAQDAALAWERAGNTSEAIRFAERARGLDDSSAAIHALLGKLYVAGGRREEAVQELTHAVTLNPDLDSAVYLLARTYQQMGDHAQAVVWSDKLVALKHRHEAEFAQQKKAIAPATSSSTLLQGGSMPAGDATAGVP